MAASISFIGLGGSNYTISNLNSSGLGFFGAGGFGNSVAVGAYQSTTFITDGNGINQGPQVNNVMWVHPNSGQLAGATNVNLTSLPNYQGTLQIQFLNSTPCRLQNSFIYIYDRTSINNPATGVTTATYNIIHPNTTQGAGGSGLSNWEFPTGSSYSILSQLGNGTAFSPGISGLSPNGAGTVSSEHDYYVAISASPNSIGSKNLYGLLFSTEYL
jgi:hypothetical protein